MKKLVSVLLIVCLCFSLLATLAACQNKPAEKETDENTTATKDPDMEQSDPKTTVTKDEFVAALATKNFTVAATGQTGEQVLSIVMKSTDSAIVRNVESQGIFYTVQKDGIWYELSEKDGTYIGVFQYGYEPQTLADIMFPLEYKTNLEGLYDKFSYNEEEGCYYAIGLDVSPSDREYRIYFENGVLSKFRSDEPGNSSIGIFSDINKTTVDIPNFTVAP